MATGRLISQARGPIAPRIWPIWRAAVANVFAGIGRARLATVGSSSTRATGPGDGGTRRENGHARVYPGKLVDAINAMGWRSHRANLFGDGSYGSEMPAIDPRFGLPAGWASGGGSNTTVAGIAYLNSTTTNQITFATTEEVDNVKVWYTTSPAHGFLETFSDGVSLGTVNAGVSSGLGSQGYTVSLGAHTFGFAKAAADGKNLYWRGVECWDSTRPAIEVFNCGWGGTDAADWDDASSPGRPLAMLATMRFDLVCLFLGLNAASGGLAALAAWKAHYQNIITALIAAGSDILLIIPHWQITSVASLEVQLAFHSAIYELSAANGNLPVLDLAYRHVSFDVQSTYFEYVSSPSHFGRRFHADTAYQIARAVINV